MRIKFLFLFFFLLLNVRESRGSIIISGDSQVSLLSDSLANIEDTLVPSGVRSSGRPRVFDWITNIPGDWWNWSKQAFTVKQLVMKCLRISSWFG